MNRNEFKSEIIGLYAKCGSHLMIIESKGKSDGVTTTRFRHPTCPKIIEVSETESKVLTVLVYNDTYNASQRNCVDCKSVEQLKKAVYGY